MVVEKKPVQKVTEQQLSIYVLSLMKQKVINNDSSYLDMMKAIKKEFGVFVPKSQLENYFEPNLAEEATDASLMFKNMT